MSFDIYKDFKKLINKVNFTSKVYTYDDDNQYEIFKYNYINDKEIWKNKYALNMRGTMFNITSNKLVCWPMPKFFNLHELDIDISKIKMLKVYNKLDGSIMSTFFDANNRLRLKSNYSLTFDKLKQAEDLLYKHYMYEEIINNPEFTYNFEYCGPDNTIVVKYDDSKLVYLSKTSYKTGNNIIMSDDNLKKIYYGSEEIMKFINDTYKDTSDIEGYVCNYDDVYFKLKTNKYIKLHRFFSIDDTSNTFIQLIINTYINNEFDDVKVLNDDIAIYEKNVHDCFVKYFNIFNKITSDMKQYDIYKYLSSEVNDKKITTFFIRYKQYIIDFDSYIKLLKTHNDVSIRMYSKTYLSN